jgi:hypothetical protein
MHYYPYSMIRKFQNDRVVLTTAKGDYFQEFDSNNSVSCEV